MKLHLPLFFAVSLTASAADYAVTFYQGDLTGIPDGWPKAKRELAQGEQPLPGETFVTEAALSQMYAERADAMAERNRRQDMMRVAPAVLADQLRQRIASDEFQTLKIDALQSELVSLLVDAYVRNTRLLQLVTKAVAGTTATNNLTAAERTLVGTLRSELVFGDGNPITTRDKQRFVDIRDGTLKPHYQLFLAAKAVVDAWRTNAANAPDPYSPTNLPAVAIGE